ncbi:putative ubiquitin-like-specific protease 1B [Bienertia sinuspersici]
MKSSRGQTRYFFDTSLFIFFPVYFEEHFYLYVFNFNDNHLDIIDNKFSEKGIPLENKYYDFPQQMINGMLKYHLRERIEDRVTMMRKMKTRVVEIPWRDNTNFNDCGVFVMRHMETYMGRLRGWECGFSPNSDNAEYIRALRIDYAKQILSDESNNNKEQFLHEVKAFEEKQKKA